ncbi:hypothetical protein JEQ12_001810 [Ovis aries]|uniref:Uncharacterized protein n=1 Tax=Ovis aries TaxID=9940 RepID=A0A836AFH2_SHEEP|nr:hypothetical protein JEQ12_001810 [Ovis aries]
MKANTGAVGGPGGPGSPGIGGWGSIRGDFGSGVQGQGCGQGQGWGKRHGALGGKAKDKVWLPDTKLGPLVKDMKIKFLEEVYLFSFPIKESEIIVFFLGTSLKDEVLKTLPVQKQAFAATGDRNRHVSLGVKCFKKVATALLVIGAITLAKLSIISKANTVSCKVTGCCGSVLMYLIPALRGTGIVLAPVPKPLLMPFPTDLWKEMVFPKSPYQEFTDHLVRTHTSLHARTQAPAVATT